MALLSIEFPLGAIPSRGTFMRILLTIILLFSMFACNHAGQQDNEKERLLKETKQKEILAEEQGFENSTSGLTLLEAVAKTYDSLGAKRDLIACELKIAALYRRNEKFVEAMHRDSLALNKARAENWYDLEFDALVDLSLNWKSMDQDQTFIILHAAEQVLNRHGLAQKREKLCYENGILHMEYSRFNEALVQFDSAILLCRQSGNNALMARSYSRAAMTDIFLANYEKAADYGLKALAIQEKEDKEHDLAYTNTVLALVFGCTKDIQKQRYYNRMGLQIMRREKRKNADLISLLNNTAHSYAADFPDSSLFYYYQALDLAEELGLESNTLAIYMNIGNLYLNMGQMDSASKYLFSAKAMGEKNLGGDGFSQATLYAHLSIFYEKKEEIDLAIDYMNKGLEIYTRNASFGRGGSLNHLSHLYALKGDYKKAYEYKSHYIAAKDSHFNMDVDRKMVRLSALYEIEKKDAELIISEKNRLLLDQEVHVKQRRVLLLSAVSVLFLLMTGIVLYFLRQKSRNEQELKSKNERIHNLMHEMTHRVKNNFQVLSNVFSLQAGVEKDGSGLIRENKARVDALLLLHQKLSVDDTLREINPVEYINELTGYLILSYGFPEKAVTLHFAQNIPGVDVDRLMPLGLIVNEMVSNAMKHAIRGVAEPRLFIGLSMLNEEVCVLTIRDNGMAREEDLKNKQGSLGMRLLNIFARQLQATLSYKIDMGLEWTLEFNIYANFPTPDTHT